MQLATQRQWPIDIAHALNPPNSGNWVLDGRISEITELRILCVFGTRPEAIKMAPVVRALRASPVVDVQVCVTGQHRQMLDQVLDVFEITPNFDLGVMSPGQDLSDITGLILARLRSVLSEARPDMVLVHGDTTTTLASALAAYYQKIPIGHIEAGLRTKSIYSPWPEEGNRRLVSALTRLHFVPTENARANLVREGFPSTDIYVTGNTVIDALLWANNKLAGDPALANKCSLSTPFISQYARLIVVTGHRRENFGSRFEEIFEALREIALSFPDVGVVYPVHLNPQVREPAQRALGSTSNIHLIEPMEYLPFVQLMGKSALIMTDSGGIQEEAPSLGKPVLVMRDDTERPEGIAVGTVKLVGATKEGIVRETSRLLSDEQEYQRMSQAMNPYGDGRASERIVGILEEFAKKNE